MAATLYINNIWALLYVIEATIPWADYDGRWPNTNHAHHEANHGMATRKSCEETTGVILVRRMTRC